MRRLRLVPEKLSSFACRQLPHFREPYLNHDLISTFIFLLLLFDRPNNVEEASMATLTQASSASRFQQHVGFDNIAGAEPTENNPIAFTLNVKHTGYKYKRRSRTFMVGVDENAYSNYALQWMLDEMVDDGDEIVCLRVIEPGTKLGSDRALAEKKYKEEAHKLMGEIQAKNDEHRAISIVLEIAVGKLHTTFTKMVRTYARCSMLDT